MIPSDIPEHCPDLMNQQPRQDELGPVAVQDHGLHCSHEQRRLLVLASPTSQFCNAWIRAQIWKRQPQAGSLRRAYCPPVRLAAHLQLELTQMMVHAAERLLELLHELAWQRSFLEPEKMMGG